VKSRGLQFFLINQKKEAIALFNGMMEDRATSDIDIDGWDATMNIGGFEDRVMKIIDISRSRLADINEVLKGSLGL